MLCYKHGFYFRHFILFEMPSSLYAAAPSQSAVGMDSQESRVSGGIDSKCCVVDHLTGS